MLRFQTFNMINEAEKEQLDTSVDRHVVIAPGRYNPPTRGHAAVIKELIQLGHELHAKPVIIVVDSGKYDERNPLTGEVRKEYLHKMFPGIDIHTTQIILHRTIS